MPTTDPNLPPFDPHHDDHELAARVAEASGRRLVELRARVGAGRPGLGDEGDRSSHRYVTGALHAARPDDPVRSEEDVVPSGPPGRGRLWIVDPLDGTREYTEGRSDFAVHVALVDDGRPVAGAVALPAEDLVFATTSTSAVPGQLPPRPDGPVRIVVSRTRPPAVATQVAARLGAELVPLGSAGAKAMAVVRGAADVYLHAGGQYEWDSAAPVAVALWSGAYAARLDGSPLVYGREDPWIDNLVVCRPELTGAVMDALGPG